MSDTNPEPQQGDVNPETGKTYTKQEMDGIIAKAVAKATRPFQDYADLQAAKEELDALKAQNLTAEERTRVQYEQAVKARDTAMTRASSALMRQALVVEAVQQGAHDPDAVVALVDKKLLTINDSDEVEGVEEAVKALLASKPYLKQQGARRAGAEFQGAGAPTSVVTRSQHRQWLREGGMTSERQELVDKARAAGTYVMDR